MSERLLVDAIDLRDEQIAALRAEKSRLQDAAVSLKLDLENEREFRRIAERRRDEWQMQCERLHASYHAALKRSAEARAVIALVSRECGPVENGLVGAYESRERIVALVREFEEKSQ